jgi:hypothetical protein
MSELLMDGLDWWGNEKLAASGSVTLMPSTQESNSNAFASSMFSGINGKSDTERCMMQELLTGKTRLIGSY